MNYTKQQHDAIYTHDRNLIVTAGAGSGKTRVLVDRFIALLDAHPDWPLPSLVAITFTEKAAREMRDRVRRAIEQQIAQATEADNADEIRRWRGHEAALDSARIGTIHSLCTSILRANAALLSLDPQFGVLDEVEGPLLRADAIEQALAVLSEEDQAAARLLVDYGLNTMRDVLGKLIALPDGTITDDAPYLEYWQALYEDTAQTTFTDLRADAEFIEALNFDAASFCSDPSDKMMQNWQLVISGRAVLLNDAPIIEALAVLNEWAVALDLRGGKAGSWGGKEIFDTAKAGIKVLRDRAREVLASLGDFGEVDQQAAAMLPLWGDAIRRARTIYESMKAARRVLDFDDLESLTRDLLRNPEVAQRYQGAEFRHILVDEFQDTNAAQRDIIYALAGLTRPGSLFVVGDPRQSIYRFRGADVTIFEQVRDEIVSAGGEQINLYTSFRTHDRLVGGFNAIFSELLVRSSGPTAAYEVELGQPMVAQRVAREDPSPCLEVIEIDKERADERRNGAGDLRQWEALSLARRLREMVEESWEVWDKRTNTYRPMHYGDAAILFQSTTNMPLVEEVLKAASVPYVTIAGKGYYNRSEVWDLLNLLKALYNPFDDLSLATALRSPLYSFSDDDLFALRLQGVTLEDTEPIPLWQALTDADRVYDPAPPDMAQVQFARESLRRLREVAGRVTIAELLVRILDETAYLATLTGLPDGARRCANVEKLIEVARRSKRYALGDFTAYLQDLSDSETREGEAMVETEGAVQLMTIHASKGLEFPVVALIDASWEYNRSDAVLLLDPVVGPVCKVPGEDGALQKPFAFRLAERYNSQREAAERLRLLYVGMTRAQDYVLVSGQKNGKGWLGKLVDVLKVKLTDLMAETEMFERPWGKLLLRVPLMQPPPEHLIPQAGGGHTAWDDLDRMYDSGAESAPPLLDAPPVDRHAPARMLSASELALLGEASARGDLSEFRAHVLRDAPTTIRDVARVQFGSSVSPQIIGDMVHKALRWWRLPGNTPDLGKVLDSYAWEQGITDPKLAAQAIKDATRLLELTEQSGVIVKMKESSQVYRDLPFTLRLGERTISGMIDALFFTKYQRWTVVDYKTSAVEFSEDENGWQHLMNHSARYHAQLGIYAAAVEAMTGQTPDVYLHYIPHIETLRIDERIWRSALDSLDRLITDALEG